MNVYASAQQQPMPVVVNGRTWTLDPRVDGKLYSVDDQSLAVYPIDPDGIFAGQEALIPNTGATWSVRDLQPLDGSFSDFGVGGTYKYTRGVDTGSATFVFDVFNADGIGGNLLDNVWTVTVQ